MKTVYKKAEKEKPCFKEDCTAYCIPCKRCGLRPPEYELCKASGFIANYMKVGSMGKPVKTSTYKGVSFHKNKNKWQANISIDNKTRHLGYFLTEKEAASAYEEVKIKK